MRAGVWWSAAALALLVVASAQRTAQDGTARISRRPTSPAPDTRIEAEAQSTFRPRGSRRREDVPPREVNTRTRSRPTETPADSERPQPQRNERFDSRRTNSRARPRPAEEESKDITHPLPRRDSVIRSRGRQGSRSTLAPSLSTPASIESSSPTIDETKIEVVNSNLEELSKLTSKAEESTPKQFRRRGSTPYNAESTSKKPRGRVTSRTKSGDLEVSGTTNSLYREHTTPRSGDFKATRKLRYRSRLLETDSNTTGEELTANEVKSSQNKETTTSQPEIQTAAPIVVADMSNSAQSSSEAASIKSTTEKITKVVRRPLKRGKMNFRPTVSLPKLIKPSDEISEDDNYPASFKALIQAKNASTQSSSPSSESLTVKASQRVYKTLTSSAQSTNTGPTNNKYARYRSKLNAEENKEKETETKDKSTESSPVPDQPKTRPPQYRPRSAYNPRNRKSSTFSTSTTPSSVSSSQGTAKPVYKFNRKFKVTTTTAAPNNDSSIKSKRIESNNLVKKSLARPSYYSRRKNMSSTESAASDTETVEKKEVNAISNTPILPKTSYYSRLRNKPKIDVTSTVETITEPYVVQTPAEKKNENSVDMPLIFSLLNNKPDTEDTKTNSKETVPDKEMFIIAVTSKESSENSTENEVNKAEDNDNKPSTLDHTQKYHAMYTDNLKVATPMIQDQITSTSTPPIRNFQTRKYNGRKNVKPNENSDELQGVTPKPKERNSRKFSDTYAKSTEPSTNGIPPDPDKHKSRFSSKYRASYLDKPFYKPTVPTITPSTAWLKFFITDHELAKSLEDPYWFSAEDIFVTTQMSKLDVTPPPTNHETSLELVEGEEFQIGPDMNAIAFTMPRSPLSSADLKLSESLVKPSQIQNVEASQHSASVTVSIFDALADILTSTPRTTRLSSTTEVTQKQTTITDSKQTLNGVSNSINVNTMRNSSTSPVTDVNLTIKSVQTTYQTTPNVNNRLSVGESATQSLNTEGENITPVNTPTIPTSTPTTPTTPVSARRPFAIRVLYSDTEPPTDKPTTATPSKPIEPSTDSPTTVYNTVSDLILTNKNLVSSELTSMLSNNIKSLMQNMDEKTRLKVSGRMAKLLNSIIPRAVNGLETANDDVDSGLNTTPYSLEEIQDTENVDVDKNINKSDVDIDNFLQTVESVQNVVNSTIQDMSTGVTANAALAVNSPNDTFRQTGSTLSLPSSQTTSFGSTTISTMPSQRNQKSINSDSSSASLGRAMTDNSPNVNIPLPFFTNAIVKELIPEDADDNDNQETTQPDLLPLSTQPIPSPLSKNVVDLQYPSNVSPLQLWVLSKKARVLQMIEDLIRQHNDELATAPPLTDMFNQVNNIPLSNRLTEIINTMTSTTESPSLRTEALPSTSPFSTPIISTISTPPIFTFPVQTDPTTIKNPSTTLRSTTTKTTTVESNDFASTIAKIGTDIFSRFGIASAFTTTESPNRVPSTTPMTSSTENSNDSFQSASTVVNTAQSTSEAVPETTTASADVETTTSNIETTTATVDIETTTQVEVENTTTSTNEINQSIVAISNRVNINTSKIPKKDYVIFGILPNNTVVRKDPNDDVLESLTEASPYIVYGVLPNNTIIRRFPNGTRVPRVMQKIDILPISPWSLRNPYSPIHNNPAIVRPQFNPIRVSTNTVTPTDINNGTENVTNDTVNNLQQMIPTSALNIKDSSSFGVTTAINKLPAEKSTASHVLSLRTTTMLPSVDEILLNSISSAVKEEMVISSMTSSTHEPRILTLDIDPETQQIRTEKPSEGDGSAVFKFIPIDEVMVAPQDSNVLKLATSKATTSNTNSPSAPSTAQTVTEINTQTPQIQTQTTGEIPTTVQVLLRTSGTLSSVFTNMPPSATESFTFPSVATTPPITTVVMTTAPPTTTSEPITATTDATTQTLTTTSLPTTTTQATTIAATTITSLPTTTNLDDQKYLEDARLLEHLFQATERSPKSLNAFSNINQIQSDSTTSSSSTTQFAATYAQSEEAKILQAILAANQRPNTLAIPNIGGSIRVTTGTQTTTTARSIEDEIRQFEEDTKLLKALLAATGQNPASLNIPSLDSLNIPTRASTPATTTVRQTTTIPTTSTARVRTTTPSFEDDLKQFNEDTQLLQTLLQATGQKSNSAIPPVISGVTSNVRIASNPLTTSIGSNPTTPINIRPVYTSRTTTPLPPVFTSAPSTLPIFTTLQQRTPTATTEAILATTYLPTGRRRQPTTTTRSIQATLLGRRAPVTSTTITTEVPSTSTFSDEEDLLFLQNLKSALNTNTNGDDPESDLANRIIALAVEKSLNEIQTNQQANDGRTGKSLGTTVPYRVPTTTTFRTTTPTTTTTTTTPRPTTTIANTPSLEDDIKQFQEDTKLLQALLKATGQDPSQFNIPTFPSTSVKVSAAKNGQKDDLKVLSNLLASPSPLNEPFDSFTQKPAAKPTARVTVSTTPRPFGAKIVVKDDLKNVQDDAKLLQTLIKLQGVQETTTQRNKLTITGQSPDEALQKLIQQTKPTGMVSEATKAPISISTEFGKSNDALLAALLKEQGFGPTTASSLDEQLRLAALLNQVVVTPKARRTTTEPPPPPAPAQRRPVLDGLAWLWQQWRETAPGPTAARPNRRPAPSAAPAAPAASSATSNRLNWFGSGPFVGNADDAPPANRIPLEPPRTVTAEQTPGRGQLVSAAINVTRAFSQFLGAAIQGAAQTVQSVIRAGQRAATDVYTNGSG